MPPPQQRFGPDDVSRDQIHLRLVLKYSNWRWQTCCWRRQPSCTRPTERRWACLVSVISPATGVACVPRTCSARGMGGAACVTCAGGVGRSAALFRQPLRESPSAIGAAEGEINPLDVRCLRQSHEPPASPICWPPCCGAEPLVRLPPFALHDLAEDLQQLVADLFSGSGEADAQRRRCPKRLVPAGGQRRFS